MEKIDLNKIKDEIISERQNKSISTGNLVKNGGAARDTFLNGLITSLQSGKPTHSSNLINEVSTKAAIRNGEEVNVNPRQQINNESRHSTVDMSLDRDEQLFHDLEKKKNMTLAESMERFGGNSSGDIQRPMTNYNGNQYLTQPPQQQNNGMITENVKEIVNNHLAENLSPIFEEAIKGTIIEMYAIEQIKKVLNENRDLIKSVVVETIREIQAKNKVRK